MRSKNEAVIAGGCFRNKMSMGLGALTHNWLILQAEFWQHSGSSQSTNPSGQEIRESQNQNG